MAESKELALKRLREKASKNALEADKLVKGPLAASQEWALANPDPEVDKQVELAEGPSISSGEASQRLTTPAAQHEAKKDFVKAAATEVATDLALGGAGKAAQAAITFIPAPKEFARHGISKISAAIPEAAKKKFLAALDRLREVDQPEYVMALDEYNSVADTLLKGPGPRPDPRSKHDPPRRVSSASQRRRFDKSGLSVDSYVLEPEDVFNQHLRTIDHIGQKSGLYPPKESWQNRLKHIGLRDPNRVLWEYTIPDAKRSDFSPFPTPPSFLDEPRRAKHNGEPYFVSPYRARVLDEDIVQIPLDQGGRRVSAYNDPAPPGSLSFPEGSPGALSLIDDIPGALSVVDDFKGSNQ